ncbi:MAG: hypothetical protein WCF84_04895 [Anaerolineae bacterium]
MVNDPFQQREDQYFRLRGQLGAGQITRAQYEAALNDLVFQAADGHYWMLGADSGKWYVHDGQKWVEANPPAAATPPLPDPLFPALPPPVSAPPPAASPPVAPPLPPPPPAATRRSTSRAPLIILAVIVVVLLLVLGLATLGGLLTPTRTIIVAPYSSPTPLPKATSPAGLVLPSAQPPPGPSNGIALLATEQAKGLNAQAFSNTSDRIPQWPS